MTSDLPKAPKSGEITPESVCFNRRTWMKAGLFAAAVAAAAGVYRQLTPLPQATKQTAQLAGLETAPVVDASLSQDTVRAFHANDTPTPYQSITHYNNFYEFSTDKDGVAGAVGDFSTSDWKIVVDGMVSKPMTFDLDDIRKVARPEERIYRFRCVET